MTTNESHPGEGGVRVTNADIYRLLLDTNGRVASVEQTVRETLRPGLDRALARIESLEKNKADKEAVTDIRGRTAALEMRVYAIVSGLIAALFGAKGLGIL